jgi:ribosomal protein S18 acetylase RimI-like enzyme
MTDIALSFRKARVVDASVVAALVNSGYRGDVSRAGWTTEADYLVGKRTDEQEVRSLIESSDSIVLLCLQGDEIVGSVHLHRENDSAYLGMFVVRPTLQGQGIGKRFLTAAEETVQLEWASKRIFMAVISLREALIAYYERRGYRRTGRYEPFPIEDTRSTALVSDLRFEVLEKILDQQNRRNFPAE